MKIVVIGGSGLIGKQLVKKLSENGIEAIAASPSLGVNSVTGLGLQEAMSGAKVIIDVTNSPVYDEQGLLNFFGKSMTNLIAEGKQAGVEHLIVLSIIGTQRIQGSAYMSAKKLQEDLARQSGIDFTIIQSAQFYEFLDAIIEMAHSGGEIRLTPAQFQPLAASAVVDFLAHAALAPARNETIEIAGPEKFAIAELAQHLLNNRGDTRAVISDKNAPYGGTIITLDDLLPQGEPVISPVRFNQWLEASTQ